MPADNMIDKTAVNNIWGTPEDELALPRRYFDGPIPLDPATQPDNPTKALKFFTEEDDGLAQPWDDPVFVNPPYSDTIDVDDDATEAEIKEAKRVARAEWKQKALDLFGVTGGGITSPIVLWAIKIRNEANRLPRPIIALLPCGARFSTWYWQDCILTPRLQAMCVVRGRISFVNLETGETKTGQNNYDSIYYGFNVDVERFSAVFRRRGSVFAMHYQQGNMMEGFV